MTDDRDHKIRLAKLVAERDRRRTVATDPLLTAAAELKKELETDTPQEFQDAVRGPMEEIMKILLEAAAQDPPDKPS